MSLTVNCPTHGFVVRLLVLLLVTSTTTATINRKLQVSSSETVKLPNGQLLQTEFVAATPSRGMVDETCQARFSLIANVTTAPANSVSYFFVVDRSASTYDAGINVLDICGALCGSGSLGDPGLPPISFSQNECCFEIDRSTCPRNCVFNNFDTLLFEAVNVLLPIPSTMNMAIQNFGTTAGSVLDFTDDMFMINTFIENTNGEVFTNCNLGLGGVEDTLSLTDADLGEEVVIVFMADGFCNDGATNVPAPNLSVGVSTRLARDNTLISVATEATECSGFSGVEAAVRGQTCLDIPNSDDLTIDAIVGSAIAQAMIQVFDDETGMQVSVSTFDFPNPITAASQAEIIFSVPTLPLGRYTLSATGIARTQAFDVAGTATVSGENLVIEAVDLTPPILTCFSNVTILVSPPSCQTPVFYPEPIVEDNCDGFTETNLTRTAGLASGSTFGQEGMDTINVISYLAIDGSGNSAECSFSITTQCPIS